jgi:hypothetical protein
MRQAQRPAASADKITQRYATSSSVARQLDAREIAARSSNESRVEPATVVRSKRRQVLQHRVAQRPQRSQRMVGWDPLLQRDLADHLKLLPICSQHHPPERLGFARAS